MQTIVSVMFHVIVYLSFFNNEQSKLYFLVFNKTNR